jgi:hypothetical protein
MEEYGVDPTANPVVRANAKFILWWEAKNEAWSKTEDIRHPIKLILWEVSWPLLLVSHILLWVYATISSLLLSPLNKIW